MLLGIPLVVLFYHFVLGLDWPETLLIALKQSLNGIFNAALAGLILLALGLVRRRPASVPISDLMFSALLSVTLFPALLITVSDNRQLSVNLERDLAGRLGTIAVMAVQDLAVSPALWEHAHGDRLEEIGPWLGTERSVRSDLRVRRLDPLTASSRPIDGELHLQLADDGDYRSRIERYRHSRYLLAAPCREGGGCAAIEASVSTAPLIARSQSAVLASLRKLALLTLVAVMSAGYLSRLLTRTLRRLIESAASLPVDIASAGHWRPPGPSRLVEMDSLATTLTLISRTLTQSFQDLGRERRETRSALDRLRLSESRLAEAQRIGRMGSWFVDLRSGRTEWSDQTFRLLGYRPGEVEPDWHHFVSLVHPDDRAGLSGQLERIRLHPEQPIVQDIRIRERSGEERVLLNHSHAHRDASGQIVAVEGISLDITERKSAELALKAERGRLSNIIEATRLGTWEWNIQTGETLFNEHWARICGYSLAELEPTSIETWYRLAHPDDLQISSALIEQHLSGQSDCYECELRMRHKDGRWVWVRDQGRVVEFDADGRPLIAAGTHTDVTDRKRAELDLLLSESLEKRYLSERQEAERRVAASEKRLRAAFDHASIGIAITDARRRIIYSNHALAALLGRDVSALIGRCIDEMIYSEDISAGSDLFDELMAGERDSYRLSTRYLRADGDIRWGDLRAALMPRHEGDPTTAVVMVEDITELRAATERQQILEEQLSRYALHLERLVDLSSDQGSAEEEISALLAFACASFGASAATLGRLSGEARYRGLADYAGLAPEGWMGGAVGRLPERLLAHEPDAVSVALWSPHFLKAPPEPLVAEGCTACLLLRCQPGIQDEGVGHMLLCLWYRHPCAPLESLEEQLLRLIAQRIMAVEHRHRIQRDLVLAKERETIGHLASGISHDFNNLLGAVDANFHYLGEALLGGETDPDLREVFEETQSALDHAKVITTGLLSLSRAGGIQLGEVDIVELLDRLAAILRQVLPPSIDLRLVMEGPVAARTNGAFLQSALLNMVLNARDAMPAGGRLLLEARHADAPVAKTPRLGVRPRGAHVEIRVRDTGCGMDEATQARIFEPLFSTKARQRGHGLGLFMVQELVSRTGAALAVESTPGQGTELCLMLAPAAADRAGQRRGRLSVDGAGSGICVLLVEDDPPMRDSVARVLGMHGIRCEAAEHGGAALDRLRQDPDFDLVLSDINMPVMDGLALLRQLGQDRPELPIILMTGRIFEGDADTEGVVVLQKPVDPQRLVAEIVAAVAV